MNIRSILRSGLVTGTINIFVVLLGLTALAGGLVMSRLGLSSQEPGAWLLLLAVALCGAAIVVRRAGYTSWGATLIGGLLVGAPHGLMLGAFTWLVASFVEPGPEGTESLVRSTLVHLLSILEQINSETVRLITLGRSPLAAAVVMFAAMTIASLVGAVGVQVSARYNWWGFLKERWSKARAKYLDTSTVRSVTQFKHSRQVLLGIGLLLLLVVPQMLGRYWNYTLGTVGIYVMLGLGLNVVVGMAGLLDIGYVAFFAVGAYTVALLTAPEPHHIMMNFWLVLPLGIVLAAISGVLLGIPVLGVRGDYLAIVTLGFGEIIRILSKSLVLMDFTGGPRGIRSIGRPDLFGFEIKSAMHFTYLIVLGIVLVALVTDRLQHSRVGRAWMAIREDEDVAEAMGINTLRHKLLAFAIGAAIAGLSGVVFASRNMFTGPEDFILLVSINVLCLVIIGGMGSIPGVVMGALVLKGLPEVLRELDEYRMLAFGALLVVMMIIRPEGLWPSRRRKMELHDSTE